MQFVSCYQKKSGLNVWWVSFTIPFFYNKVGIEAILVIATVIVDKYGDLSAKNRLRGGKNKRKRQSEIN